MKLTSRTSILFSTLLILTCLSSCSTTANKMTIPVINETNITEAVKILDIDIDIFKEYLDTIDITFDEYLDVLNENNQSLDMTKSNIEKTYDCTFEEYIKTFITVSNKIEPDKTKYSKFESNYSLFDVYLPIKELDKNKNRLVSFNTDIMIADTSEDAFAFDVMQACNNDFATYVNVLNERYNCISAEFSNILLFGNYGVKKPTETNKCLDSYFVYDEKTNEILEPITVPVLTMHFDKETDDISLALSNELGIIFKTVGADSKETISKITDLDIQIRKKFDNNNT